MQTRSMPPTAHDTPRGTSSSNSTDAAQEQAAQQRDIVSAVDGVSASTKDEGAMREGLSTQSPLSSVSDADGRQVTMSSSGAASRSSVAARSSGEAAVSHTDADHSVPPRSDSSLRSRLASFIGLGHAPRELDADAVGADAALSEQADQLRSPPGEAQPSDTGVAGGQIQSDPARYEPSTVEAVEAFRRSAARASASTLPGRGRSTSAKLAAAAPNSAEVSGPEAEQSLLSGLDPLAGRVASPNSQAPEQLATFATNLALQRQDKALAPVITILEAADENLPASIKDMARGYSLLQQDSSSDELALFHSEERGVDRLVVPSFKQLPIMRDVFNELGLRHGSGSAGALLYSALHSSYYWEEMERDARDFAGQGSRKSKEVTFGPSAGSSSSAFVSPALAYAPAATMHPPSMPSVPPPTPNVPPSMPSVPPSMPSVPPPTPNVPFTPEAMAEFMSAAARYMPSREESPTPQELVTLVTSAVMAASAQPQLTPENIAAAFAAATPGASPPISIADIASLVTSAVAASAPPPLTPESVAAAVAAATGITSPSITAAEVAAAVAASTVPPDTTPKSLRPIVDGGHVFTWASRCLSNAALNGVDTSLSGGEQRGLLPATQSALTSALVQCEPERLLSPLAALTLSAGVASELDYAEAHCQILRRLVTAVIAIKSENMASSQAAQYLWAAVEWAAQGHSGSTCSAANANFRTAWDASRLEGCPSTPTPMLLALSQSFVRMTFFGNEDDYRTYLLDRFKLEDLSSMPSSVLLHASRVARSRSKDPGEVEREAKKLFSRWVSHAQHQKNGQLLSPIVRLLDDISFMTKPIQGWTEQVRVLERENSQLHPLRLALDAPRAPISRTEHHRLDRPRVGRDLLPAAQVHAAHMDVEGGAAEQIEEAQDSFANTVALRVARSVPRVYATTGPHLKGYGLAPVAAEPLIGAHSVAALAGNLVGSVGGAPGKDVAFDASNYMMDASWVARFGCTDLGPVPNLPVSGREWLQVTAICNALSITIPPNFQDMPHVGGSSCPFCAWWANNQGLEMSWWLHPNDAAAPPNQGPKPMGRQHKYFHQVFKCPLGYAVVHRTCRLCREGGNTVEEARYAALFAPNVAVPKAPPRGL